MAKKATNVKAASTKGETAKAKPQVEAKPLDLSSLDEAALLEALNRKREGKRTAILAEIEELNRKIEAATADLRAKVAEKHAELRALGGTAPRRSGNGGSINPKGAAATTILAALKDGPLTVKGMKELPSIAALMEGKYEKSYMAVNLAALREKGLVEQTANRGEWRLTADGSKAATEAATA